jgi:hypothetical protein
LLVHGRWFSPGTPASSTTKTGRHDVAESGVKTSKIKSNQSVSQRLNILCITGADPGFQVRGGAIKKIAPSGGRREHFWGISCEKSRFYAKKSIFFQLRREARKVLGISCEKSRFYAKKSYFFQF